MPRRNRQGRSHGTALAATSFIDYLAKDYEGFRRKMIAVLKDRMPQWEPASEADLDLLLLELLALVGDELAEYQDWVANEAYLSSARTRESVTALRRLIDYELRPGKTRNSPAL